MSKICCIFHNCDLDGWMSAAIVRKSIEPNDELIEIGYNYGQEIPDLSEFDEIIMVDISFPAGIMESYAEKLVWIDHHISAIKANNYFLIKDGYTSHCDDKMAACELAWEYFFPNEQIPEIVRLLGRYDCFGHKGTSEEKQVLEFQYGARGVLKNVDDCFGVLTMSSGEQFEMKDSIYFEGVGIYKFLCTEAKQSYKNGFEVIFNEPTFDVNNVGKAIEKRKFICINKERFNPINFGIDYHADGYDGAACFHYANGKWNFSLYNDNGLVDCSVICKQYGGGGHMGAAGFTTTDISQFTK